MQPVIQKVLVVDKSAGQEAQERAGQKLEGKQQEKSRDDLSEHKTGP